nr:MAG TPA: Helix-turn-helix XRE-family like protein [Crassvirales sp.]
MKNESDLRKYAGSVIRKLRERKNMSQDELAEQLNITRQAISRYENGDRGVNQDLLFQLASIFNVKIDEFFPPLNNNYSKQKITKEEEFNLLKDTLKKKGFLDENEDLSEENYNRLIDFAKANKPFIIKDTGNNK